MITEQQRIERKGFLGSSDIGAILGLNPNWSAYDVFAEKTGRTADRPAATRNDPADWGNRFEDPIVDWLAEVVDESKPGDILKNERIVHPGGVIAVNFDAIRKDHRVSYEAKTTGLYGRMPACDTDQWGEEGSCDVPMRHLIQCMTHFAVVEELELCRLAAVIHRLPPTAYEIRRDNELVTMIVEAAHKFKTENIDKDIPPDAIPSPETFKRMRRIAGKSVRVDAKIVKEWIEAKARVTLAEKIKEEATGALRKAFGDAEIGEYEESEGVLRYVTYLETHRKGYPVEPTTYRQFRTVKTLKD